jgi:hypothetical protein
VELGEEALRLQQEAQACGSWRYDERTCRPRTATARARQRRQSKLQVCARHHTPGTTLLFTTPLHTTYTMSEKAANDKVTTPHTLEWHPK